MLDSCVNSLKTRILLDVDGMPRLPLELERMIFELAVSRNGAKASAPLLLVAKRVREWYVIVKPFFFILTNRNMGCVHPNYRTAPLMFRVLNQIWPPRSIDITHLPQLLHSAGHFVQHLIIDSSSACGSFRNILSSCPNLHNLAIHLPSDWGEVELNNLLHVLQSLQRLTRLTVQSPCLSYIDILIQPSCFLNLTHLEILLTSKFAVSSEIWDVFSQFPKLTHVSVEGIIRSQDVLKLLHDRSGFPLLELLVVVPLNPFYYDPQHLEVEVKLLSYNKVKDKRLVVLEEVHCVDAVFDWKKGANGGVDMWRFAELVVFARESEYFLFFYICSLAL